MQAGTLPKESHPDAAIPVRAVNLQLRRPPDRSRLLPVKVVVPPNGTLAGTITHVELAGAPVQLIAASPGTPASELSSKGKTADTPLVTLTVVAPLAFRAKSTPMPCSEIVCGEPAALSVTVIDPACGPADLGPKKT